MTQTLIPYEPETLAAARARLYAATREVQPEGGPGHELKYDRRHVFDLPCEEPLRLVVSVDDGEVVGPKLHASLWRVAPDGQDLPLGLQPVTAALCAIGMVRELTGNLLAEPFLTLAGREGDEYVRLDAFFPFTTLPSAN